MFESFSPVLMIAAGLLLLFSGRRIFWLAAALTVFLFVYRVLQDNFGAGLIGMVIAAVIGLVFAWLAINFIKTMGLIVGALAGAVALPYLLGLFGFEWPWWIMALIGAVIGVIFVSIAFDLGLVVMTSWIGANVVSAEAAQLFALSAAVAGILFIVLIVAGIAVQLGMRPKSPRRSRPSTG